MVCRMSTLTTGRVSAPRGDLQQRVSLRVKAAAAVRSLSQGALADALPDVSRTGISRRLAGVVAWQLDEIETLADSMQVHPDVLLGYADDPLIAECPRPDSNRQPTDYKAVVSSNVVRIPTPRVSREVTNSVAA